MKQVGREGKETATGRDTIDPPRRRAMAKETAALRRRLYILGALEREREKKRETATRYTCIGRNSMATGE